MPMAYETYTTAEIARREGVTPETIRRWARARGVRPMKAAKAWVWTRAQAAKLGKGKR